MRNKFKKGNKHRVGLTPWNKGKRGVVVVSKETKLKLSKARIGNKNAAGSKNHNWKGGITNANIRNGFYVKRRRARKFGNGGYHTLGEWSDLKAKYNFTCPCCGLIEPKIKLTEDHIIPLSRGGSDNIENIQPLCIKCNSRKHTKIICYS